MGRKPHGVTSRRGRGGCRLGGRLSVEEWTGPSGGEETRTSWGPARREAWGGRRREDAGGRAEKRAALRGPGPTEVPTPPRRKGAGGREDPAEGEAGGWAEQRAPPRGTRTGGQRTAHVLSGRLRAHQAPPRSRARPRRAVVRSPRSSVSLV